MTFSGLRRLGGVFRQERFSLPRRSTVSSTRQVAQKPAFSSLCLMVICGAMMPYLWMPSVKFLACRISGSAMRQIWQSVELLIPFPIRGLIRTLPRHPPRSSLKTRSSLPRRTARCAVSIRLVAQICIRRSRRESRCRVPVLYRLVRRRRLGLSPSVTPRSSPAPLTVIRMT